MNAHNKVRIGILGCANIAWRSVIPAILELEDDFELVAVSSRNSAKASLFATQFGCEGVVGYDSLIDRSDIDALYIPLPTGLHSEWVARALSSGKHVYVEKSFAPSFNDSKTLVEIARTSYVAAMEGYMFLYHRQHAFVKSLIQEGAIGNLRNYFGCFGFPPLATNDFRYDATIGGGALMDAAGYPLRAAYHYLGQNLVVSAASCHTDGSRNGTILWGSAFLVNESNIGATISYGFDNFYQCRYELWGSSGKIVAERAFTPAPSFSPLVTLETASGRREFKVEPDNHFLGALREFKRIIGEPQDRETHYNQIMLQSSSLENIRNLCCS